MGIPSKHETGMKAYLHLIACQYSIYTITVIKIMQSMVNLVTYMRQESTLIPMLHPPSPSWASFTGNFGVKAAQRDSKGLKC